MSVAEEFKSTLGEIESLYPLVLQMADKEGTPMWEPLKHQSGVDVSYLPVGSKSHNEAWAKTLPHMVKGSGIFSLSLPNLYDFLVKQDFAFRQQLDPLVQVWDTVAFMPENKNHQLYLYHANFKPPTRFIAPRDFLFLGQTYFIDVEGKEIPLPSHPDNLEDYVAENADRIQRIVMINRSVTEEEIEKSHHKGFAVDPKKVVRGFIRCIATVIDKKDDNSCKAQILCDMDPGGYIPEWVKGIIATHNAGSFVKLKNYLETHKDRSVSVNVK